MNEIVYLDVCCFKRPFDDATQERVRREAEAVAEILDARVSQDLEHQPKILRDVAVLIEVHGLAVAGQIID